MDATLEPAKVKDQLDTIAAGMTAAKSAYDKLTADFSAHQKSLAERDARIADLDGKLKGLDKTLAELRSINVNTPTPSRGGIVKSNAQAKEFLKHIVRCISATEGIGAAGKGFIKDLSEGESGFGAELLHPEFDTTLTRLIEDYGAFKLCRVIPMARKQTLLPVESAFPNASFIAEAGTITPDTTAPFTQKTITAKKVAIIRNISRELLQDAEIITPDIVEVIMRDLAWAIAKRVDFAVFNGDGTDDANNGAITGVTVAGTAAVAAAATSFGAITQADILNAMSKVNVRVLSEGNAAWYCSGAAALKCFRSILDANDRPLYNSAFEPPFTSGAPFKAALNVEGYPLYIVNILNGTDGADKVVAVFGDLKYFTVGLRQDVQIESSPYPYWTKDQVSYRAIARVGGSITDPAGIAVLKTKAS